VNVIDISKVGMISVGMVLIITEEENVAEDITKVFGVVNAVTRMFGT
jgi:hypothetical protein